jgi:hypothetical protein
MGPISREAYAASYRPCDRRKIRYGNTAILNALHGMPLLLSRIRQLKPSVRTWNDLNTPD